MQAKTLFKKFIMGQDIQMPRAFDCYEITQVIAELDAATLFKVCQEAFENQDSEEAKYEGLTGWGSGLDVDVESGGLAAFASLIDKIQAHPQYTQELGEYLVNRLNLNWGYHAHAGEEFCPRVSAFGHFAIRHDDRLLKLSCPAAVLTPGEEQDAFEACLEASWLKAHTKADFKGFTLTNQDGVLVYSKNWPTAFNAQGQSLVCVPAQMAQDLAHKLPSIGEAKEESATGCVYVRRFGDNVYVYGDTDVEEESDLLFGDFAQGFVQDPDLEEQRICLLSHDQAQAYVREAITQKVQMWLEGVVDLEFPCLLAKAFQEQITHLARMLEQSQTQYHVPFFSQDPLELGRTEHQRFMLHTMGLDAKPHPVTDVISTNFAFLAEAYEKDAFVQKLRERIGQINHDLSECGLPMVAKATLFVASNDQDDEGNDKGYLNLGDVLTGNASAIEAALKGSLTRAGYYVGYDDMDESERFESFADLLDCLIQLDYSSALPWQCSLQIAENFSEFGRALLVSGRLSLSASCENFQQEEINGTDMYEGFEGNLYDDWAKSEHVSRYDNEDSDD